MRRISVSAVSAATLALASPALAGSTDYLLKLGGIEGGGGSQLQVLSYSWGETRSADIDGNGQVDPLTDGLLIVRNSNQPGSADKVKKVDSIAIKQGTASSGDGHSMLGASDRGSQASAHQRQKEIGPPPAAGSLTVIVAPGHGLCTAGKSLGTLTLAGSGGRAYVLDGVTVAGCKAAAGGDRPAESLSLNYKKVTVKGWNPEKKED